MSTHHIFDKQCIKVKDRFIVMQIGGDNNFVTSDTGRIVRSWYPRTFNGKLLVTVDDIKKDLEEYKNDYIERYSQYDVTEENLMISNSTRIAGVKTYKQLVAYYVNATKKAVTPIQLRDMGYHISIVFYHNYNDSTKEKNGYKSFTLTTMDEKEIIDTYEANKDHYSWISVEGFRDEKLAKRVRQKYFPRKRKNQGKERVLVNEYWTIVAGNGGYFIRNTARGYKYSYSIPKYILTKDQAEKKVKKLQEKYPDRGFKVEKETGHAYMMV